MEKAKRLIGDNFIQRTDIQLQKDFVKLKDFVGYIQQQQVDKHAFEQLMNGGYFVQVADQSASGIAPKDIWMKNQLEAAFERASKERSRRIIEFG